MFPANNRFSAAEGPDSLGECHQVVSWLFKQNILKMLDWIFHDVLFHEKLYNNAKVEQCLDRLSWVKVISTSMTPHKFFFPAENYSNHHTATASILVLRSLIYIIHITSVCRRNGCGGRHDLSNQAIFFLTQLFNRHHQAFVKPT